MIYEKILDALEFLKRHRNTTPEALSGDRKLLGSILWYLYTTIQGSIDLGLKVISKLKLRIPESYADVFLVLRDEGIIPEDLARELVKMAKFRHILAHIYFKLDLEIICEIIREKLGEIEKYLRILADTLKQRNIKIEEL